MRASLVVSLLFVSLARPAEVPVLKVNEVREIAPGVFFRFSAISPTDPSVFGGSNHIWIVFEDFVVVIDANFPKEARDVLQDIRKTTNKPIRYVLDTHHHGDHAWGNAIWAEAGATILAHRNCAKLLRLTGPADFAAAGKGPMGRKDVASSTLKQPSLIFDDRLVLDDGKQRVEFLHLGHSHTIGDAVAYLPRHKILCTGDACVNGPYNYMGQSDSASWIRCLEKMQELDIRLVAPGHGQLQGKELLAKQKRYFQDLRRLVKKGIDEGKEVDDIVRSIDLPWYKEWTSVKPASDNIKHVYNEYMGLVSPWDFEYDFGILAGPSPTKDSPGWTKPRRIVLPAGLLPARLAQIKQAAPEIEFLPARTSEEAAKLAKDVDAVLGFATPSILQQAKALRWVHLPPGPIPQDLSKHLDRRQITFTESRRVDGPHVADQSFALLLGLTRRLLGKDKMPPVELRGKTMLLIGQGNTAEQIHQRASAFGMKVVSREATSDQWPQELREADVIVLALPLTPRTKGLIGANQIKALKKGAFLINAAHPALVDLDALAKLPSGHGLGIGLDVLDPEAAGLVVLRKMPGVLITQSSAIPAPDADERRWRLLRENVRRFAAGEPLLGVVEP